MRTTPAPRTTTTTAARRPRRARRAVTVAASATALVLAFTACGSSDESAAVVDPAQTTVAPADAPPTTVDEPTETSTPVVDQGDDPDSVDPDGSGSVTPDGPGDIDPAEVDDAQDRVERINLTLEDLPAGWTSEPPDEEVGSVVETCTAYDPATDSVAKQPSDRFSLVVGDGGLTLDTSTGYLVDEATAEDLLAEIGSEEFAACATEQLVSADGVTVEGSLSPVGDVPLYGDDAVALQGEFDLSDTSGASVHLSATIIAVRTDQVITTVAATAVDTEGDAALLSDVLDLVEQRQEL